MCMQVFACKKGRFSISFLISFFLSLPFIVASIFAVGSFVGNVGNVSTTHCYILRYFTTATPSNFAPIGFSLPLFEDSSNCLIPE